MIRNGMDVVAFSPFLNSNVEDWEQSFDKIRRLLDKIE
jgi:hypothetical protein